MATVLLPDTNIGLIGHVDHGKTTLTSALSGKWTDTHSQELKRGITIKLGYADVSIYKNKSGYTTDKNAKGVKLIRRISLVDAPGHETLMAVMISGAAIMDGAILLISANEECPQPQTSEHLIALKVLGIKDIIVVQNKVDLVSKEEAKKNHKQIKSFVKKTLGFEVPVIPISAQKKINLDLLLEAINGLFKVTKVTKGIPKMVVARSFDINKPGSKIEKLIGGVLGGAVISGEFKKGDEIEIRPGLKDKDKMIPVKTKIVSMASGKDIINKKGPGGSVAVSTTLDPSITSSDALVGNLIGLPGKLPETLYDLDLELNLFEYVIGVKEGLKMGKVVINEPLMINSGTAATLGIVSKISKTTTRLNLKRAICANVGSKVAISRKIGARWHLIGYGVIQ